MPRCWAGPALAGALALLTGCGAPTPAPQIIAPAAPGGFQLRRYPEDGFQLAIPRNWTVVKVNPPLVAVITSGPAVISMWRYPETGSVPRTAAELRRTEQRLIAAARGRDHALRLLRADEARVDGYPAVELQTMQTIGRAERLVQSTHLYRPDEEVVLEEYAPPSMFGLLDRSVFSAVRRSLRALGH